MLSQCGFHLLIHCNGSASGSCSSASHQAALARRAVKFSRNFRVITRGVKFSSHARAMLVSFHAFRHQICVRKCLAMCSPTLDKPRMNKTAELGIATATAHLALPPLWSHSAAGFRSAIWPCGAILCIGAQGCNPVSKGSILCFSDPTDLRRTWPRLLFQFRTSDRAWRGASDGQSDCG